MSITCKQILIGLLAATFLGGCDSPEKRYPKATLEQLQGDWSLKGFKMSGHEAPEDVLKKVRVTFLNDKITIKPGLVVNREGEWNIRDDFEAKVELGSDGKTHTLDLITGDGEDARRFNGIYVLDGDDLRLCYSIGDDRPSRFESKRDSLNRLFQLKREKR